MDNMRYEKFYYDSFNDKSCHHGAGHYLEMDGLSHSLNRIIDGIPKRENFPFVKLYYSEVEYVYTTSLLLAAFFLHEFKEDKFEIPGDIFEEMQRTGKIIDENGEWVFEGKLIPRTLHYPLYRDDNSELTIDDIHTLFRIFVEGFKKGLSDFEYKISEYAGFLDNNFSDKVKAVAQIESIAMEAQEFKGEIYPEKLLWYGYHQAMYYLCWLQRQKYAEKFKLLYSKYPDRNSERKTIVVTFKQSIRNKLFNILKDYVPHDEHPLLELLINGKTIKEKIWFKASAIQLVHALWFLSNNDMIVAEKKNIALWLSENWYYQKRGSNNRIEFDFETYRTKISQQDLRCKNPIREVIALIK